jgi:anti-sigma regulatory factor (Ser/Thr protein kinase)/anti-anti-sigma regulatory factor
VFIESVQSLSGGATLTDLVPERDLTTGVTVIRPAGALTQHTLTALQYALGKAAAECPTAVIVDLNDLTHAPRHLLSIFATTAHQAQRSWGVPVLLCAAEPGMIAGLGPFRGFVAHYESQWQAMLAVRAHVPRWMWDHFAPVPSSARAARGLVDAACQEWDLGGLRDWALLVVSELAANAIRHAGTEFDVTVAHTGRYLRIAVQDRSPAMPHLLQDPKKSGGIVPPGSGRGLRIVAGAAAHWGTTRLANGKIVWSLLRDHTVRPADD